MINTYRLREFKNNVSLVLRGKGGNSVRYEFKYGNVAIGKYPSLTLTNKYQIDLLEKSELFASGRVVRDKSIKTDEDIKEEERLKAVKEEENTPEPENKSAEENVFEGEEKPEMPSGFTAVKNVRTQDELIAYINDTFGKDFRSAKNALNFATKNKLHFPSLNMV